MGLFSTVENHLIETVALAVLNTSKTEWDEDEITEYRKGWLDGYAQCYGKLTGETRYQFIWKVNKMIEGSGNAIRFRG